MISGRFTIETDSLNIIPGQSKILAEHKLLGFAKHENVDSQLAKDAYKSNLHRNTLLFSELQKMTEQLDQHGIQVTSLKGMSLLTSIYKDDWGLRSISDIDVLIHKNHQDFVRNWLFDRGYSCDDETKFYANNHKEVWRRTSAGMDVVIEIHYKLFSQHDWDFHWPIQKTDKGTYVLEPNYELIYLISHLAHQHTFLKLFWLFDIDIMVRKMNHKIDWQIISHLAQGLKVQRSLDATLFALKELFSNKEVPNYHLTIWKRLLTWQQLIEARNRPGRYFVLKHALKDSLIEALKYDFAWLGSRLSGDKDFE